MLTFFFQPGPVRNYDDAKQSDTTAFGRFFHHLLEHGVYFPPSQFEAAFVSTALTPANLAVTAQALRGFSS